MNQGPQQHSAVGMSPRRQHGDIDETVHHHDDEQAESRLDSGPADEDR